jgi:hypothetical protein
MVVHRVDTFVVTHCESDKSPHVVLAHAFAVVSLTPHYSASTDRHVRNSHIFHMMPFHFKLIRQIS